MSSMVVFLKILLLLFKRIHYLNTCEWPVICEGIKCRESFWGQNVTIFCRFELNFALLCEACGASSLRSLFFYFRDFWTVLWVFLFTVVRRRVRWLPRWATRQRFESWMAQYKVYVLDLITIFWNVACYYTNYEISGNWHNQKIK